MKLPYRPEIEAPAGLDRFSVILVRPENLENVGLAARAMKNTGFSDLRIVGTQTLNADAYRTAIHASDILDGARYFPSLPEAVEKADLVLASTARFRKTSSILTMETAVETVFRYPAETRFAVVFGNERTGLSGGELGSANFVFFIPQASRQPSYNLGSAVLLTLFAIFRRASGSWMPREKKPIPRKEQEDCISLILKKLEDRRFIHETNRGHMAGLVRDLFGRIALTERDKRLLLAIFGKAID
ncbi:MAG: TrmH family RNA methyltransferase [Acidobacteriota bacterium]|nr:TrmH family RNA methyltransferase [Acidobacteriota bacterium]